MARPELPGAAVPHSAACSSISVGGSRPLFQPPAKNALLFFVLLWYIGLGIVKAALKSSIFLFFLGQLCYFNLSPQGDENFLASSMPARYQYFNLSPQGDENILTALMDLIAFSFQLIPARGRKPINEPVFASQAVISTYPRKGTETSAISLDGEWMPISTYPRKGAKTPHQKRCGVFLLQTLTLCFPWAIPL